MDAKCHFCGEKGHYQRVCRVGKAVLGFEVKEDNFFLLSVTSEAYPWTVDVEAMDKTFKLDTGAHVTGASVVL